MSWLQEIRFNEKGLVPVVAQEASTGEVLMLAWANEEAIEHTMQSGRAHYHSRSRGELWAKGETSGNHQTVVEVRVDCDGDALLYLVRQTGPACHTGKRTCFHRTDAEGDLRPVGTDTGHILSRIEQVVGDRAVDPVDGSYTNYLLLEGIDKVLKKVGEEATEVVIAAKNPDDDSLRSEVSDLLYHLVVLLHLRGVPLGEVWTHLDERFGRAPRERKTDHLNPPKP